MSVDNRNIIYNISKENEGMRIDKYLAEKYGDFSRSYIQKLIDEKNVTVNKNTIKRSYKLISNDEIKLIIPEPEEAKIEAVEMKFDIIYEDKDLIVINKAPGRVIHPSKGHFGDTVVNGLLNYTENLSGIKGVKRPGIVHRLDKDTSGVLLIAKNDKTHRFLAKEFKKRNTKKIYRALLCGQLPYNKGKIDAPIGRDKFNRKRMAVKKDNSKKAITIFKVLERYDDYTYVEIELKTGRTHQIRVHFSYLGNPVLGDEKYGGDSSGYITVKRQLLHAYKLGFNHPGKNKFMKFTAPLPDDFLKVLEKMK